MTKKVTELLKAPCLSEVETTAGHWTIFLRCLIKFQHVQVQLNTITHIGDDVSKSWIAQAQPAPWGDAIGLVLKLLRTQLIEILEPDNYVRTCKVSWGNCAFKKCILINPCNRGTVDSNSELKIALTLGLIINIHVQCTCIQQPPPQALQSLLEQL